MHCIFEKATGLFVNGARWGEPQHDPKAHVLLKLPAFPDWRTERWDGATGVRPATAEEVAEFDAMMAEAEIGARLDDDAILGAVIKWVAGQLGLPPDQARRDIGEAYRAGLHELT